MRVVARLPAPDDSAFTQAAANSLVGRPTRFGGRPAKVIDATFDPKYAQYVTVTLEVEE